MRLLMIIWATFAVAASTGDWKCGGEVPADGVPSDVLFQCEYDHVDSCNIFPDDNYTYVGNAFVGANTRFAAYFSDTRSSYYVRNAADIEKLALDNAETWANGSRMYPLYLASINAFTDSTNMLGVTLHNGQPYVVITLIFHDTIEKFAKEHGLDVSVLVKGVVIHELGHARKNLAHLCNGLNPNTYEHDSPNASFTCIMADQFPRPQCLDEGDKSPLDNIGFCDKCIDLLKQVTW